MTALSFDILKVQNKNTQAPHIMVNDIHMHYQLGLTQIKALQGITIELARGEFVALCGSSGSGKTTLLNLLGCLDRPNKGEILISGHSVGTLSDAELAGFRSRQLGFIFQTFNLLPVLNALENVEYPLVRHRISAKERRQLALETLRMVGLERFAAHRPDQLSGGQRQRVAIARAIVHRPDLLIADEPTANLDKKTASGILDLIVDLNKQLGVTVIIATHDPLVVMRTQRVIYISDGKLK